jgi:hypothetical protein
MSVLLIAMLLWASLAGVQKWGKVIKDANSKVE